MPFTQPISEQVSQVIGTTLRETAATLTTLAAPAPPLIHMFSADSYLGWIGCRPYEPGRDAHNAIVGMAWPAAALSANRILVAWEDRFLRTALSGEGDYVPAVLIADIPILGRHTVNWWPYTLTPIDSPLQVATLEWVPDATGQQVGLELPPPVAELADIWKANRGRLDPEDTVLTALDNDYRASLVP